MSKDKIRYEYPPINLYCDQKHDHWWEYIWHRDHADNFHDSQHIYDDYSFAHFLVGAITFYLVWLLIGNKNYSLLLTIAMAILFEIEENKITNILKYVKVDGNISSGSRIVSYKNIPFKYKKNGETYTFVTKHGKIYKINGKGKRIKDVKMDELKKYKLPIYRGDSYINIIGDIMANIIGGAVIYSMVDIENANIFIMLFIVSMMLVLEFIKPKLVMKATNHTLMMVNGE
jgi:hypothetical protein